VNPAKNGSGLEMNQHAADYQIRYEDPLFLWLIVFSELAFALAFFVLLKRDAVGTGQVTS
jgi:hypothetical protein